MNHVHCRDALQPGQLYAAVSTTRRITAWSAIRRRYAAVATRQDA